MAREMSPDEIRAFLETGTRTGKLATVRPDGRPHIAPIWFVTGDADNLWGFDLVFNTGAGTVKGRSLIRDGRAALTVDDERPPFAFVLIEGTVEISEDLDEMLTWATRIGGRYMGADRAEAFGRRNAVEGELLVRLRPTRVTARAGVAE
jgi:PPOX class probable F420-dependent enzyme